MSGSDPFVQAAADPASTSGRGGWRQGRPVLVGLLVLVSGIYLSLESASLDRRRELSERKSLVQRELSDFRARLETDVYASTALVRGLAVQLMLAEGISDHDFDAIAAELLRQQPQILNLSLAPGFVIRRIHPLEGNEAALGLDLLQDPVQSAAMRRAISQDDAVLAGPFELVQGGRALAVRIPLWLDREGVPRLWGAVSMVLDYDAMLERAGLRRLEKELDIAIVGRDAAGPGGELFRGRRHDASVDAVRMPVFLPGGSWLITAVPREGWLPRGAWLNARLGFRLLVSLLAALAITRILRDRQRIRRLAERDALTDLPNRRHALRRLSRLIVRGRRGGERFALFSFDLDGFKPVNDTHGHAAGDRLLTEIAQRLGDSVRPGDLVARMGGDEFVVLVPLEPGTDDDWLRAMARRLQAAVGRPVAVDEEWVVVGASIGIARFPEDGDDVETLLRKADEAMYRAKSGGSQGVEFATPLPLGRRAQDTGQTDPR
ncbi:diguanylate cyclase domain-containing protein [Arenimonas fontis]|uniref:Sensor domain-containing diguanylate cyclase n=1 Tax=Arenimonas fontis TaxID=2608255 RepID=A0A5B2ZE39_9GAMM|nr:diguanylate cyclase [Arenimonas fontis]KAA2285514.1 sensor domain-containing diguanylate cyclase [Arenimonas fontis]